MNGPDGSHDGSGARNLASTVARGELSPGDRIDRYALVRLLGEGGMGEVWLAEQTDPIRRQVALKVIKRGMDTATVLARFEVERQALALMSHPAVARVFDAGTTGDGRPYFVMEYVDGEPITTFCDTHTYSIPERIGLFQKICEGVQHAHQKGIIHRDLKPSNVLVTMAGDIPQPKVIDFGVAKAIQQRLTERTLFTELGVVVGTPEYMSPEQAEGVGADIDTRTDVYTLGVLLYELLAGVLPFDPAELRDAGWYAMLHKLLEEEPSRPSERTSTLGEQSGDVARRRGTDPVRLARTLQGDLDWIVMKAMDKDRARRYGSPAELAADLGRHLLHEPVQARPPSVAYQVRKFVRRHALAVGMAAVGAVALVGFAGAMAWQARRIAVERNHAEWVTRFLVDLFLAPDPTQARGQALTAVDLLDRGAERIAAERTADPVLRARVMAMLGRTYEGLGAYEKALPMVEGALAIQREQLGPDDRATIGSMHNRALLYGDLGQYVEAEAAYREAIAHGERALGKDDRLTLTSMANLASTLLALGRRAEAESLHTRVLALRQRVRGPDHLETLSSALDLAVVWQMEGKYAESERLSRETVEHMRRVLGADFPETLKAEHNLAVVLNQMGRYDEAAAYYEEALAGMRRVFGDDHPSTLSCMMAAALNYAAQRRFAEAEPLMTEAADRLTRVLGADNPRALDAVYNRACLAALKGDRDEAIARLEEAVARGWLDGDWMARDADLESLHGDPRFAALVARARANAAAAVAGGGR